MKNINGNTKLFSIIGNPVKHSMSPNMYNYSFEKLGLDCVYLAFELENDNEVSSYIDSMKLLNIAGGNITMPYKATVIPFLDEISTEAEIIGAVNTLVNDNGKIKGYNTDGKGLMLAIQSKGVTINDKSITLFGAGGAANAILYASAFEDASEINIIIEEFSPTTAVNKTISHLKTTKPNCDISISYFHDNDNLKSIVERSDIIINATPLGMNPKPYTTPLSDSSMLSKDQLVVDIVYNPRVTTFLHAAQEKGCKTVNGLDMLLWQAVKSFELFTFGQVLPIEELAKNVFNLKD